MRKSRQEITDPEVLEEILEGAIICRLALTDGQRPYIVPVNYGFRDGCLFVHSAPAGKKIDLLRKNPEVCFEVEQGVEIVKGDAACEWSTRYRSVVGYARVEIQEGEKEKREGLEIIMAQHGAPELTTFKPENIKSMVILKLTITSLTGKQSSHC
jgi:nitroimidazol reductase NimA-like FMN-containing flavoprotein (pyridoxamine 5'-phosphate oxidase superfamily)